MRGPAPDIDQHLWPKSPASAYSSSPPHNEVDVRIWRRVAWRIIPLLFVCFVFAQMDRLNVGFAKLRMLDDLGFSETVYGAGVGIFFLGYILFEVPSNILLVRIGPVRWLSWIMIAWGALSSATMFTSSPLSFYILRLLLGAAEAGFVPGVVYYLGCWFASAYRSRATAFFMSAAAVSGIVVGPVSGLILSRLDGVANLHGWQWLFALEGLPAVLLGIALPRYLDASPSVARWLTETEKVAIVSAIDSDRDHAPAGDVWAPLYSGRVWVLSGLYAAYGFCVFGFIFWLPTFVSMAGVRSPLTIGLITAIPWAVSAIGMILVAMAVDRYGRIYATLIGLALVSATGWALAPSATSVGTGVLAISAAMLGPMASIPVFWGLPVRLFHGRAAAVAFALITTVGNAPGFFAPFIVGYIKEVTGSLDISMYSFGVVMIIIALIVVMIRKNEPSVN